MSLSHGKICLPDWRIQVLCSRSEGSPHFLNRTLEYHRHNFQWDRLISHQNDNLWPSYSQDFNLPIFWGGTWKTEFVKTIHRQERTSSEEKSDGFHKKCSIELWTILMLELLLCYHTAAQCMERKLYQLLKQYSKTLLILEWFPRKQFYKLPVTVEKKSWRFPYLCESYCQRKIRTFLWATLYTSKNKCKHLITISRKERHVTYKKKMIQENLTSEVTRHNKIIFSDIGAFNCYVCT